MEYLSLDSSIIYTNTKIKWTISSRKRLVQSWWNSCINDILNNFNWYSFYSYKNLQFTIHDEELDYDYLYDLQLQSPLETNSQSEWLWIINNNKPYWVDNKKLMHKFMSLYSFPEITDEELFLSSDELYSKFKNRLDNLLSIIKKLNN